MIAASILAGPVIGIAAFVLFAFIAPGLAWPGGLLLLLGAPGFCCYFLGRRFGGPGLANTAAIIAAASSLVTSVGLVIWALSTLSFE